MAFYNRKMAHNEALTKAWKAGHRVKLNKDDEIYLPEICGEIARWMRRDRRPRNRLSLRSFSILLSGAVRIYRDQVNSLLEDSFNCSLFRKSTTQDILYATTDQETSRKTELHSESDENYVDDEKSPSDDFDDDISDEDLSTVFTASPSNNQVSKGPNEIEAEKVEMRDQTVQTSPTPEEGNIGFDPNLPFGYLIIHDNYNSTIPSKILFSSLAEDIKFLPIRKPMN